MSKEPVKRKFGPKLDTLKSKPTCKLPPKVVFEKESGGRGAEMNSIQARVVNGLHAHFKQPSGPSRPGHDWIVLLTGSSGERKILARTYDDDAPGATAEQQAQRALEYVAGQLDAGLLQPPQPGNPDFVIVPKLV